MRGVKQRLTVTDIERALKDSHGLISKAAGLLGCHRSTLHQRIKDNPRLQEFVEQCREDVLDLAESQLFEALQRGEAWAIQFTLRTIGKERGYCERHQQEIEREPTPQPILAPNISDETIAAMLLGVDMDSLQTFLNSAPRKPLHPIA